MQIWFILLLLLPASIIMSWLAIPKPATDKLLQPFTSPAFPLVVKTTAKENYIVNLRKAGDSSFQVEWINKKPIPFPAAGIYKVPAGSNDIKNGLLIGRIEGTGTWRFTVDKSFQPLYFSTYQLLLYDFIHQQAIDTINFR